MGTFRWSTLVIVLLGGVAAAVAVLWGLFTHGSPVGKLLAIIVALAIVASLAVILRLTQRVEAEKNSKKG